MKDFGANITLFLSYSNKSGIDINPGYGLGNLLQKWELFENSFNQKS